MPSAQQRDDEAGDGRVLAHHPLVDLGGEALQLPADVDVDRGAGRGLLGAGELFVTEEKAAALETALVAVEAKVLAPVG